MKKVILAAICAVSVSAFANNNWKQLSAGDAPPPMGSATQPVPNNLSKSTTLTPYSVAFGFAGSKIGNSDGSDETKGAFINTSYQIKEKANVWAEYAYQKVVDSNFSEISLGGQYRLFESPKTYNAVSLGLGYAWLDDSEDVYLDKNESVNISGKLKYITIPISFEYGYKFNQNISAFGAFGYKWWINNDVELCVDGVCASERASEINANGVTYKAGLRYNF